MADGCILRHYDVRHAMGEAALVDEMAEPAQKRGGSHMKLHHGATRIVERLLVDRSRCDITEENLFCYTYNRKNSF